MVAYSSGGSPGILVRLFTNAALTTQKDVLVPITDKTQTGVWQRMPFTVYVDPGQSIYGVGVYVMPSWSTMPGGQNISTVVFDNMQFDLLPYVATGQVAVNSVGLFESSYVSTTAPFSTSAGTEVSFGSLAVSAEAGQDTNRVISFSCNFSVSDQTQRNAYAQFKVYVNGVAVTSFYASRWPPASATALYTMPISFSYIHSFPAGSAYTVEIKGVLDVALADPPTVYTRSLTVAACKR